MADLGSNPAALSALLASLANNDTTVIKNAEKTLKKFTKTPACIPAFFTQVEQSPDMFVRHQAALLLKKNIVTFFKKFDKATQEQCKTQFLRLVVSDQEKGVSVALAGAVASLSKIVMAKHQWPELFQLLTQLTQHQVEKFRSLGFSLLAQLAEQIPTQLLPHLDVIVTMLVAGCKDSPSVATEALTATSAIIRSSSENEAVMKLQPVIPPMLQVLQACVERGDEDLVLEGFEVLDDCCTMQFPLINDYIEFVIPFVINILTTERFESSIRRAASTLFCVIIENRPKLVGKKNLVPPCINALIVLASQSNASLLGAFFPFNEDGSLSNPAAEGEDDDDDDEDWSDLDIQKVSQTCLDTMAIKIPAKYFVAPALELCSQRVSDPNPKIRKAGALALGVIAEGCADSMRPMVGTILPKLLSMVQDPEHFVRESACFAIGQFSEHLPETLHHHESVLPVMIGALEDSSKSVQGTSCYVLETFCEYLQPESMRPFLPTLMQKLVQLLHINHPAILEMALSAISATSVASEMDFLPYVEGLVGMLRPFVFHTDEKFFSVRGRAMECLGHIAVAVKKQHFAPYFSLGMESAMQAVAMDNETLKEFSYVYIANTVKVMGAEVYSSYLSTLVPHLMDVINESELTAVNEEDEDDEEGAPAASAPPTEGADDDDEDLEEVILNVEEGFVNTKKAALTAVGALCEHAPEIMLPYLELIMNTVISPATGSILSLHTSIRAESVTIAQYFVKVAAVHSGLVGAPPKGEQIPLAPNLAAIVQSVMNQYLEIVMKDDEKLPVAMALEGMHGVLDIVGMSALTLQHKFEGKPTEKVIADVLMQTINLLLGEKTLCQKKNEQDDDEDENHDDVVIDSATDLICALGRTLGEKFIPYFDVFLGPLMKFADPKRPLSDRSMAIGCVGDTIMHIGPAASKYIESIIPAVQTGLADSMESVRRNSAFCLAAVVECVGEQLSAEQVGAFLQWLYPLCIRDSSKAKADAGGADIDNALSAVARMTKKVPAGLFPYAQVLPILLNALPLQADPDEGPTVYGALMRLIEVGEPTIMSLLPQVLNIFGTILSTGGAKTNAEALSIVSTGLKQISTSPTHSAAFATAFSSISNPSIAQAIQQACAN